jgi:hypothetical protein
MARPSPPPGKRTKFSALDIIIVVVGVVAIIGYNRLSIARLQRSIPNVNSKVVGEWKSERGPEHLIFRDDQSVSLIVPASPTEGGVAQTPAEANGPPPVTGTYKLAQAGKILVQLMNGKKYTTTITPGSPNRFDLIDAETEGVTTYDRVPTAPAAPAAPETSAPADSQ